MNVSKIVDIVFSDSPKLPCSYSVVLAEGMNLFPVLMYILMEGAKRLHGHITFDSITREQAQKLNMYMESLGYTLHYKVFPETKSIDIWFVPYIPKYTCHGIPYN
ncbi:hypothetical protein EB118_24580 [bacterium]|nr:hypothetical protein [bacterium]NDD83079.1 hypothetical protein [bacterium]NDG33232.1 hypothetical protein [bacterium]